jgi:3-phosphoshikimate 1-carboxyvinyltransferase
VLDMGNAGTAIRLFMGLLAGQRFEAVLTGDESCSAPDGARRQTPEADGRRHRDTSTASRR